MNIRALVLSLLIVLPYLAGCARAGGGEPRYGVCRQEMIDFVQQRLGQTPTRVEFQAYSERMPPLTLFDAGSALVYVEECAGFHGFQVRATEDVCEHIPHYGKGSGSYVLYEGAFGGCKKGG